MDIAKKLADAIAMQTSTAVPKMLSDVEASCGPLATRSMAEGMMRASVDWICAFIGPRTAYDLVQGIADELALRIVARRNARHKEG
jgi:hypothetical protein